MRGDDGDRFLDECAEHDFVWCACGNYLDSSEEKYEIAGGWRNFRPLVGSAVAGLLPPLLWMARNRGVMGDLTGSKAKIAY